MIITLSQRVNGKTIKVEDEIDGELHYENLDNFFEKIIEREKALTESEETSDNGGSTGSTKPKVTKL